MEFLRVLNNKIIIDDILIKRMRYDTNMLLINCTSEEKAKSLAKQIHSQIDKVLVGINDIDRENIRRLIISDSFLVVKDPIKKIISYGNLFTELTNYDDEFTHTKLRLTDWLDQNTDMEYDEASLTSYIKKYKVKNTTEQSIKFEALQYEPSRLNQSNDNVDDNFSDDIQGITKQTFSDNWGLKAATYFLPIFIILYVFSIANNSIVSDNSKKDIFEVTALFENHFSIDFEGYLSSYYFLKQTGIPYDFQFRDINLNLIEDFLASQNSLLVESDYINIIIKNSKKHNINPLLLLSIIGQEQGFVPKDSASASQVINNPYNVFGSWIEYNTNFEDSTQICLNTIINSAKNRPIERDFVEWLNYTYAEDKNWSKGVSSIFTSLQHINSK